MKKALKAIAKHKKPVIIFAAVALIATAVYTDVKSGGGATSQISDYLYTSQNSTEDSAKILGEAKLVDSTSDASEDQTDGYFETAVINRERSRGEDLKTLQVVVDSSETMPDVKDKALSEMMQIATDIETEANVEEMIKAKGFETEYDAPLDELCRLAASDKKAGGGSISLVCIPEIGKADTFDVSLEKLYDIMR